VPLIRHFSIVTELSSLLSLMSKSGDVPKFRLTGFSCPQLRRRPSMRAKILATLREWNILIGFCFVLGGVIFIAWISSMPPESATVAPTSAGSQPPASQLASKDAAHATPQSSSAERAPVDSARPSRPPAASEPAAHQMPGHGLAQPSSAPATSVNPANAPPAQPLAPSASSAPAAHQMHGQPPAQSSSAPPRSSSRRTLRRNP
jgi:hypothetical protein